jgi:hypothetical protein
MNTYRISVGIMCAILANTVAAFVLVRRHQMPWEFQSLVLVSSRQHNNDDAQEQPLPDYELPEEKAERLRRQAEDVRKEIENLESALDRRKPYDRFVVPSRKQRVEDDDVDEGLGPPTLRNKRVLIAGANGRLGSMMCRYILRSHPEVKEVVALVHYVGEASTRGYGRLSYEVVSGHNSSLTIDC